ncbi:MAG: bile acid:sodium symporter [Verrucomicrobia bacterium]|nr:bile acid:sodium symporter [Verrucomicrobiota bacterium]
MDIDRQLLNTGDQALLALMIVIIMFGMGASLTTGDFREALRRPKGIVIGFLSQFGWMPLIALGLALVLQLPPEQAIALILIGCLPGGTTSNMFAYFARGSVALSISMTAASTVLALIMMPLLLDLYASNFAARMGEFDPLADGAAGMVIPYGNIVVSLFLVLVPVAAGMVLRRVSPGWAKTAEDTAGFTAIIVILFLLGSVTLRHGSLFLQTPWTLYFAAISVSLIGFALGYASASAWRMRRRECRAISLETGIQNGPIALAVILLSFDEPVRSQMLWLPILYSTFVVLTSSIITLIFRRIGRIDDAIYCNNRVHMRLFGDKYQTHYPQEVGKLQR